MVEKNRFFLFRRKFFFHRKTILHDFSTVFLESKTCQLVIAAKIIGQTLFMLEEKITEQKVPLARKFSPENRFCLLWFELCFLS